MTRLTDEQRKLVADNHNLIYAMLNKYHLPTEETDDWYGCAAVGLCRAAQTYDPEKGRFSTYAYKIMGTEIGQAMRVKKRNVFGDFSLQEEIPFTEGRITYEDAIEDPHDQYSGVDMKDAIDRGLAELSERDACIVHLVMRGDVRQKDIARYAGVSRARVSCIFNDFARNVRRKCAR